MRFTPAGIPAVEFRLRHESEQAEAGGSRKIEAEIEAIAFETHARLIAAATLNTELKLQGFVAAKGRRSRKLLLHVTNVEFVEVEGKETQHATAAQR